MTPDQLKSNKASKCKDPREMKGLRTGGREVGAGEEKGQRQGCQGHRGKECGVWSVWGGVRLVLSLFAPGLESRQLIDNVS